MWSDYEDPRYAVGEIVDGWTADPNCNLYWRRRGNTVEAFSEEYIDAVLPDAVCAQENEFVYHCEEGISIIDWFDDGKVWADYFSEKLRKKSENKLITQYTKKDNLTKILETYKDITLEYNWAVEKLCKGGVDSFMAEYDISGHEITIADLLTHREIDKMLDDRQFRRILAIKIVDHIFG